MDTKRLSASEKDALVRMNVAMEILIDSTPDLNARAGLVPGGRRDIAMITAKCRRLLERFAKTVPDEQIRTYVNSLRLAGYSVGVKAPGASTRDVKNFGDWLPYEALFGLLEGCRDHCDVCSLDKTGRRACRLRKALDMIPNDTQDRPDGECPYFYVM